MSRLACIIVAALMLPATSHAQTAASPAQAAPAPAPAPDPARLAVARQIALKMLPPGTMREVLSQSYPEMMEAMGGSMGEIPISEIMQIGGLSEEDAKKLGDAKLHEVMDIVDPAWRERFKITTTDLMAAVTDMMEKLEPGMREAMARVYARDFTLPQLEEILRFLETPAGTLFGKKSFTIGADPEVTAELAKLMPEMMKAMPELMVEQQRKLDELPPRRKIEELSDEDRQKLADLLGVDVADLNETQLEPIQ